MAYGTVLIALSFWVECKDFFFYYNSLAVSATADGLQTIEMTYSKWKFRSNVFCALAK